MNLAFKNSQWLTQLLCGLFFAVTLFFFLTPTFNLEVLFDRTLLLIKDFPFMSGFPLGLVVVGFLLPLGLFKSFFQNTLYLAGFVSNDLIYRLLWNEFFEVVFKGNEYVEKMVWEMWDELPNAGRILYPLNFTDNSSWDRLMQVAPPSTQEMALKTRLSIERAFKSFFAVYFGIVFSAVISHYRPEIFTKDCLAAQWFGSMGSFLFWFFLVGLIFPFYWIFRWNVRGETLGVLSAVYFHLKRNGRLKSPPPPKPHWPSLV